MTYLSGLTLREAKRLLRGLGYTLRKNDGEYRVNVAGGPEETAYYTDDLDDAVQTATFMSRVARRQVS